MNMYNSEQLTVQRVLKLREMADALNNLSVAQRVPKPIITYPLRRAHLRQQGEEDR